MKKLILWILTAALCLTACASALAAAGDRTLVHLSTVDGYMNAYISNVFLTEDGVAVYMNGMESKLVVYREGEEPAEYLMEEDEITNVPDEDGEEGSFISSYTQTLGWFTWQGNMYAVQYRSTSEGENTTVEGGFVKKARLEDGRVKLEDCDIPQLDWTYMIEEWGPGQQSSRGLNRMTVTGGMLVGSSWDNSGSNVLEVFDLSTGRAEEIPMQDMDSIFPGTEGTLLMTRYEWSENPIEYIIRYDLAAQSEEILGSVQLTDGQVQGICLDEKNNTLYMAMNGEIRAARNMDLENTEAVTDCPLSYDANMLLLEDGRILLWNQNAAVIRNPDPAARGETFTLTVQDMVYSENLSDAVYDFTDARGDATVVLKRGGLTSGILQAMMNRDAETDIYTLLYDSSEFDALRKRGFLADLSGNAALSAAADRMYPFLQDALKQDGKLTAVPTGLSGSAIGIHHDVWKKLGGTEEELPRTWDQFLDWLGTLPENVDGTEYGVFDTWMDRESFRSNMLNILLNQYQSLLNEGEMDYAFNTPLLRGLLERLDSLDYDALKLAEPHYEEDGGMISYDGETYREPLLDIYTDVTLETWSGAAQPLLLSLEEGREPILPVRLSVAFVNPYSEHAEAAAEYLALSMKNLRKNVVYSLYTDQKEPVRDPYFAENQKQLTQWLEEAKAQLEKDEDNRAMWEENIRMYEENIADNEKNSWMIRPEAIEAYEERTRWLKILSYDFAGAMTSADNGGGDYYTMVWGYAQQQVSAQELLSGIDKKVQMMRLEGN